MFIRKKLNKSGVISVQIIDKSLGKYRMLKTIGSSMDKTEVEQLVLEGKHWIKSKKGVIELDFTDHKRHTESVLDNIEQITIAGTELLLGKLFDEIGFDDIKDDLFRRLVIARLCFPVSKLKTSDYLNRQQFLPIPVQDIYRYLDKLYKHQKEAVQQISYKHTLKMLRNTIRIVFYDVTTLYFEIDNEDELRKTGFSKEGKHQHPQIVLGLLVSTNGYPLAYEIFEGNKFEGHTMLPVLEEFKNKYAIPQLIIVADSGLLSNENIAELQSKGYEYILGARIKNETKSLQEKIVTLYLSNGESREIQKDESTRLIISWSQTRAAKDKANRERGLKKLEKQLKTGKLTKSHINNKGYNKYLKLEGDIKISIDKEKFEADNKWDGLKGYLTNTRLTKDEIIENYKHLWQIEKAFRITKTDLKIRPVYHRVQRRIEAHICIAFVAYKIYKELERQLVEKKSGLSPEKAIEIAKSIYSIKVFEPNTQQYISKTIYLTEEQKNLTKMFNF